MTSTKEDGSRVALYIPPEQIAKTPKWNAGSVDPTVALSKAVQLATQWAKGEYKRYDGVKIQSIHLTEYGCSELKDHWYYTVNFSLVIEGNTLFGSGNFAAVLMDGTVIGPVKETKK